MYVLFKYIVKKEKFFKRLNTFSKYFSIDPAPRPEPLTKGPCIFLYDILLHGYHDHAFSLKIFMVKYPTNSISVVSTHKLQK